MPRRLKSLLCTSALALVLACGGGGGGTSKALPPAPTSLHVVLSGFAPTWAAYQDGNGAWTPTMVPGGTVTLPIQDTAGRYGFAMGYYDAAGGRAIRIWQGTLGELANISFAVSGPFVTVTSPALTGLNAGESVAATFGSTWSTGVWANAVDLSCSPGTADLVISLLDSSTYAGRRTWIQRGVSFSANTTLPALDMSTAVPMVPVLITVSGLVPGRAVDIYGDWYTSGGTFGISDLYWDWAGTPTIPAVAPSQLGTGEVQDLVAYESGVSTWRWSSKYFKASSGLALAMPAAFSGSLGFNSGTGQITAQWSAIPGSNRYFGTLSQSGSALVARTFITSGWAGSSGTLNYIAPNFQSVAPGWVFVAGLPINWNFYSAGSSYGVIPGASLQPFKDGDWDWASGMTGALTPQANPGSGPTPSAAPSPRQAQDVRSLRREVQNLRIGRD